MSQFEDIIKRLFGKGRQAPKQLPRASIKHNSVDKYQFESFTDDSPRFHRLAVEEAPQIPPNVPDPDPIDFTSATPDEIKAWQKKARVAKEAREAAPPYDAWADLTRDIFYSYHHPSAPEVLSPTQVDPGVAHHAKIMAKTIVEDDHARARNITREDPGPAAMATLAYIRHVKPLLENELLEQARQADEFERARDRAEDHQSDLDGLRGQARELHEQGQPIPRDMVDAIKRAIHDRNGAQEAAAEIASNAPLPFSKAAADAIKAAVKAAGEAASAASGIPSFGQGFGQGEPRYESPEQALDIADKWANDPTLQAVAQLYGRMSPELTLLRAKRVVGGADEIVDLKFGDDLRRLSPVELPMFADDDYEDDFYSRFLTKELLVYDTVGDENAGKGPMVLVGDESFSMAGERLILLKAIALVMLNVARREKRDFAYVGFADATQIHTFLFKAKEAMGAQEVVDMCSHFFAGGTVPIVGLTTAAHIMDTEREFKKADIVMLTDGEAQFGGEDKMLRDRLASRGVRFHGIGIPKVYGYLRALAEDLAVGIGDFDLEDPKSITAHLATHIT